MLVCGHYLPSQLVGAFYGLTCRYLFIMRESRVFKAVNHVSHFSCSAMFFFKHNSIMIDRNKGKIRIAHVTMFLRDEDNFIACICELD